MTDFVTWWHDVYVPKLEAERELYRQENPDMAVMRDRLFESFGSVRQPPYPDLAAFDCYSALKRVEDNRHCHRKSLMQRRSDV